MASAVRALHQISRPHSMSELDDGTAVRALDDGHDQIPRSRCKRPRSKPTITASPTVMTGTAIRPVFAINSSRALASSPTFLAVKAIP